MQRLILVLLFHLAKSNNEWDLLIFTQHWPATACLEYKESNIHHYCERPKIDNSWTVHGVWPTKLHTIGPGFCNPSLKFNVTSLQPIYGDLVNAWPNLEGGKGEDSLWDHEWSKHGTCAISLDSLNTEEKYFKKGLEWFQKLNMSSILAQAEIKPSDTKEYDLRSIHDAVVQTTGTNPNIQCVLEKHTKKPYLFEIRVCFSKELTLVDCDGTLRGTNPILTNCPQGETIKYPVHAQLPATTIHLTRSSSFGRKLKMAVEILFFLDWIV